MRNSIKQSGLAMLVAMLLSFFFAATQAAAIPSADVAYVETNLGGGQWQYDVTISNTSDPITESDYTLFDVFFSVDHLLAGSGPAGWDMTTDLASFADFFSLDPANDILPGDSLGGFSLTLDSSIGNFSYEMMLWNPAGDPFLVSGRMGDPVPEPATMLLFGTGIAGLAGSRARKKRK